MKMVSGEAKRPARVSFRFVAALLMLGLGSAQGQILRVDVDSTAETPDGSSWGTAFPTLGEALSWLQLQPFDEIWVAEGTYWPTGDPAVVDRFETFRLEKGVAVYGGFAGDEASRDDRGDPAAHETILSGEIGAPGLADNSKHVVTISSGGSADVLDGFVVEMGGDDDGSGGGGLLVQDSSPTIRNCVFRHNVAEAGGGAIALTDSGANVEDCEFFRNSVRLAPTPGQIPELSGPGGAVRVRSSTGPRKVIFRRCTFRENQATSGGAIASISSSSPEAPDPIETWVIQCGFYGNVTADSGGAIDVTTGTGLDPSHLQVLGSVFAGNRALKSLPGYHGRGGAILNSNSHLSLVGCTIAANRAAEGGGGVSIDLSEGLGTAQIYNSLIWANTSDKLVDGIGDSQQIFYVPGNNPLVLQSTCVQVDSFTLGLFGGTGNLNVDPGFLGLVEPGAVQGPDDIDLRLASDSVCRDAGGAFTTGPATTDASGRPLDSDGNAVPDDILGNPRLHGGAIDIGAYEWHPDGDTDSVVDARDNCPWVDNPDQTDSDTDGIGDACVPHDISVTPTGGLPGDIITIQARGLVSVGLDGVPATADDQRPTVYFVWNERPPDFINGEADVLYAPVADAFRELSPGLFALDVVVPDTGVADLAFVDVVITNHLPVDINGKPVDLAAWKPNGFAYTNQALVVGQQVPQFGDGVFVGDDRLMPTVQSGPIWQGPDGLYLVAQGASSPVIQWTNGTDSFDVAYRTSYPVIVDSGNAGDFVIDIAAGDGAPLPGDLDPGQEYGIFNVSGLNDNAALGVAFAADPDSSEAGTNRVYALEPGGADPDSMHVLLSYITTGGGQGFQVYSVDPGAGYAGVLGGVPTYQLDLDVGQEVRAFYPLNELLKCVMPFPEGLAAEVDVLSEIGRARFWQSETDLRAFAVNTHPDPDPSFAESNRILGRWPRVESVRNDLGTWVPVCSEVDLAAVVYTCDLSLFWPLASPRIDISVGDGAPLPAGDFPLDGSSQEEIFDVRDKKENLEQGFVFDVGSGTPDPRVFATNVRCVPQCLGEPDEEGSAGFVAHPEWQHVLLRYRNGDGELAFQVYDVDPGADYIGSGHMQRLGRVVGDQLEPIHPLDILLRQQNSTLADSNIQLSNHPTRVWKNPAGHRLSELFCVNTHPATGGTILVSWPKFTTRRGVDGRWTAIDVFDPTPAEAPYVHQFPVGWSGGTITVSDESGGELPPAWAVNLYGESFSIGKVSVFNAGFAATAGNLNDEHALLYPPLDGSPDGVGSIRNPDPGFIGHWRVFSLLPPRPGSTPDAGGQQSEDGHQEGGEGWVLVQHSWDEGAVDFAAYQVARGTIDRTVTVGSRLTPYYPLDEILYGRVLTLPAPLDDHIVPDEDTTVPDAQRGSTGWWVSDLDGLVEAGTGSHVYAMNRGEPGDLTPTAPHVTIRWRIPKGTLSDEDEVERASYWQRFDVSWPATPNIVEIQGLTDTIPLLEDLNPAGQPGVEFIEPRLFDGVDDSAITGGYPPAEEVNSNDEHGLYLGGKLYAGRDDSAAYEPATATHPWVLLGYKTSEGGPLLFEPFRVERAIETKVFKVGHVIELPTPYLYLANYPNCPLTRIYDPPLPGTDLVNVGDATIGDPPNFGWRDPLGNIWVTRSWPRPGDTDAAKFDFHEWWYPDDDNPGRPGRNDHRDWVEDLDLEASWPAVEGIAPGEYTRLRVGEALNLSGHAAVQILFSSDTGLPGTDDPEMAGVELLVQRLRDECGDAGDFFCTFDRDGQLAEAPPGVLKFVSATANSSERNRVRASPCDGVERWATLGFIDEVTSAIPYKVECPPVQGRLVPVGASCGFSPVVRLRFWPLREDPDYYGAELLETGLWDEATIPEDLLDALYENAEGITFEWQYIASKDFFDGNRNWLPDQSSNGPVLSLDASAGVKILLDRFYRVRYTGYEACSCPVPPSAANWIELGVTDLLPGADGDAFGGETLEASAQTETRDERVDGGEWVKLGTYRSYPASGLEVDGAGSYTPISVSLRKMTQLEVSALPQCDCGPDDGFCTQRCTVRGDAYVDAVKFVHVPRAGADLPAAQAATEYVHEAGESGNPAEVVAAATGTWSRAPGDIDLPGQSGSEYLRNPAPDEPFTWTFTPPDLRSDAERTSPQCSRESNCNDDVDNDGDGFIDADDPDCPEDCTNGEDDDGDALVDAADPDCTRTEAECPVVVEEYEVWVRWPQVIEVPESEGTYWYSYWTDPMLLESWVKRVTKAFDLDSFKLDSFQEDFVEPDDLEGEDPVGIGAARPDGTYSGALSVVGTRAEGTIAFNCDPANINRLGLLELYENVLARARGFSIGSEYNVHDANQALLLVASRISQMYMLLGNEAYADALDPTIGSSIADGSDLEPEKYFAFANQVSTLLEEELVLLRGRPKLASSLDFLAPVYNRFTWNFTNGGRGETVYTATYRDAGVIRIEDAMRKFPQGHGDAYGHYVSALRQYYTLLESGYFDWTNAEEAILVAGRAVNVNYKHVRHFARAAAARARTGRDVVSLEFRQQYRADPEKHFSEQGYVDGDLDHDLLLDGDFFASESEAERAWGVHDWAARTARGAYLDWAVAAASLPAHSEEVGLKKVDRTTVKELGEIAADVREITQQVNVVDSGLNPLGMSRTVVPFDLNARALEEQNQTHFEQSFGKAITAIGSAGAILQFANQSRNRLREQQDRIETFDNNVENEEFRYKSRLVEIFGRPYPEDPTYLPGYEGPDFYHFEYIDLNGLGYWDACSSANRDAGDTRAECEERFGEIRLPFREVVWSADARLVEGGTVTEVIHGESVTRPDYNLVGFEAEAGEERQITFRFDAETGFAAVDPGWTRRPEEGALQTTLRQIHLSMARLEQSKIGLQNLVDDIEADLEFLEELVGLQGLRIEFMREHRNEQVAATAVIGAIRLSLRTINTIISTAKSAAEAAAELPPRMLIAGFSVGGDFTSLARGALLAAGVAASGVQQALSIGEDAAGFAQELLKETLRLDNEIRLAGLGDELSNLQTVQSLEMKIRSIPASVIQVNLVREELIQAVSGYGSVLGQGLRLLEERERFRRQTKRQLRIFRHNDLTFRLFHNDALQKYRAQFDLASRYAYLAVQAFDHETNVLGSGYHIGGFDDVDEALEAVIQARSPGALVAQTPAGGTGLTGVLFELGSAFEVLKSAIRMPQAETREFSLRRGLLQLPPLGVANHAAWRAQLQGARVDLRDHPEIRRLAQIDETIFLDSARTLDEFGNPIASSPALVIPFSSQITGTRNFFGQVTHGGDPGFSPEHLTTKILRCGVYLENYPDGKGRLSPTPYVYLIPVGASVMRVPLSTAPGTPKPIREMLVVDQIIPPVLSTFLDELTGEWRVPSVDDLTSDFVDPEQAWRPGRLLAGCAGETCFLGRVRKINPFVGGTDSPLRGNPGRLANYYGLAGRTAWNTEWLLVIPGRNLGAAGNDPEAGLNWLIHGQETIPIGDESVPGGVTDILLILDAYSYENPF